MKRFATYIVRTHRMRAIGLAALLAWAAASVPARAADDWQTGAGPEWADLMAKAKVEGKVVVAMGAPIGGALGSAFKRDTGLDLEFLGGSPSAISARVLSEAEAGAMSMDVVIGGSTEMPLLARGLIRPIKPLLMLPKVTGDKYWRGGSIHWIDKAQKHFAQAAEFTAFRVFANGSKVDVGQLKSFKELVSGKYKGKIAAADPRGGAGGPGFAQAVMFTFGEKFLVDLYKNQNVKITRNGSQLVEWAVRGIEPIILGSLSSNIDKFAKSQGFKLQYVDFDDWPTFTTGGRSVLATFTKVQDPNAAAVFINWYLSQPTQQLVQNLLHEPSRRTDVSHEGIPDYMFPKDGQTYHDSYGEDYVLNFRPKASKKVRTLVH